MLYALCVLCCMFSCVLLKRTMTVPGPGSGDEWEVKVTCAGAGVASSPQVARYMM